MDQRRECQRLLELLEDCKAKKIRDILSTQKLVDFCKRMEAKQPGLSYSVGDFDTVPTVQERPKSLVDAILGSEASLNCSYKDEEDDERNFPLLERIVILNALSTQDALLTEQLKGKLDLQVRSYDENVGQRPQQVWREPNVDPDGDHDMHRKDD